VASVDHSASAPSGKVAESIPGGDTPTEILLLIRMVVSRQLLNLGERIFGKDETFSILAQK
jgi:hypothetical protein